MTSRLARTAGRARSHAPTFSLCSVPLPSPLSLCWLSVLQGRKARYAIFKVQNAPDTPLEIVLEKQGDRKTSKEESEHTTAAGREQSRKSATGGERPEATCEQKRRGALTEKDVLSLVLPVARFFKDLVDTQPRFCIYDYGSTTTPIQEAPA